MYKKKQISLLNIFTRYNKRALVSGLGVLTTSWVYEMIIFTVFKKAAPSLIRSNE
jgi:uncharacterized membrane protein YGL010W